MIAGGERRRRVKRDRRGAELHRARTRDGWDIALYRYPAPAGSTRQYPVLLCHGLGSNRNNLDYPGRLSLAKYLNEQGFDCWVVELRGAGKSRRAGLVRKTYDYSFDDYIGHDLPAALKYIARTVGHRGVHWVGHSMGGMLAYPLLETTDPDLVRSATTIGSPAMVLASDPIIDRLLQFSWLLKIVPFLPQGTLGKLASPLAGLARPLGHRIVWTSANMDAATLRVMARHGIDDLASPLVFQYGVWYREKDFHNHYETLSYQEILHRITTPILFVAGTGDGLTPPRDIRLIYDRVSSPKKQFLEVGVATGFSADYGHVDLVLGRRAPDEVFPRIRDWVIENDVADAAGKRAPRRPGHGSERAREARRVAREERKARGGSRKPRIVLRPVPRRAAG